MKRAWRKKNSQYNVIWKLIWFAVAGQIITEYGATNTGIGIELGWCTTAVGKVNYIYTFYTSTLARLHTNKMLHHFPYDRRLRRNLNQCAFDVYLYWGVCASLLSIYSHILVHVVSLIHVIAYMNHVYTVSPADQFTAHNTDKRSQEMRTNKKPNRIYGHRARIMAGRRTGGTDQLIETKCMKNALTHRHC